MYLKNGNSLLVVLLFLASIVIGGYFAKVSFHQIDHAPTVTAKQDKAKLESRDIGKNQILIAGNMVDELGDNRSRKIYAYLKEQEFNVHNVREVFISLASEYKMPLDLQVTIFSNAEILNSTIKFRQKAGFVNFPSTPKGRDAYLKEYHSATPSNGYFRATYRRDEYGEYFWYSPISNEEATKLYVIKDNGQISTAQTILDAIKQEDTNSLSKLLKEDGPNIILDSNGITPLMLAAIYAKPKILRYIFEKEGDVATSIILLLCVSESPISILGAGNIIRLEDEKISTTEEATLESVKLLMKHGVNADSKLENGVTALMLSTKKPKIVSLLVENGAEVNARSAWGWTALMYASNFGHVESTKILLRSKADTQVESSDGWNALKLAQVTGATEIASLLRLSQ